MEISERWIRHYSSKHKILLVGEGNFSFSLCLASAFGSAMNITATSLDSEDELCIKYKDATVNISKLKRFGCDIQHEVDVHTMSFDNSLSLQRYDRIVFNFPHAGSRFFGREFSSKAIESHKELVRGFLENAKEMLKEDGEVHITHKTTYPFSDWGIKRLAKGEGLKLVKKSKFELSHYPGYINKRGSGGRRSDDYFPVGECSTFMFDVGIKSTSTGINGHDGLAKDKGETIFLGEQVMDKGETIFHGLFLLDLNPPTRRSILHQTGQTVQFELSKPPDLLEDDFLLFLITHVKTTRRLQASKTAPLLFTCESPRKKKLSFSGHGISFSVGGAYSPFNTGPLFISADPRRPLQPQDPKRDRQPQPSLP